MTWRVWSECSHCECTPLISSWRTSTLWDMLKLLCIISLWCAVLFQELFPLNRLFFFFSAVPTSALSSTSTLRLLHSLTVFWQKRILLNALQGVGVGGGSNSCTYTDHSEDVFPARGMLTTQQVLRLYCTLVYGGHRHWRTLGICLKTFWAKVDRNVTFPRLKLDKCPLRCCYLKLFCNWGKRLFF